VGTRARRTIAFGKLLRVELEMVAELLVHFVIEVITPEERAEAVANSVEE
jgi:hypothetical protein